MKDTATCWASYHLSCGLPGRLVLMWSDGLPHVECSVVREWETGQGRGVAGGSIFLLFPFSTIWGSSNLCQLCCWSLVFLTSWVGPSPEGGLGSGKLRQEFSFSHFGLSTSWEASLLSWWRGQNGEKMGHDVVFKWCPGYAGVLFSRCANTCGMSVDWLLCQCHCCYTGICRDMPVYPKPLLRAQWTEKSWNL